MLYCFDEEKNSSKTKHWFSFNGLNQHFSFHRRQFGGFGIIFYSYFAASTSIGIRTSESTGCKEPLLVPWNFSDILYFSYDVLAKIVQQYKCKTQSCLPISSLSRHSYLKLSAWPGSKLLTICAATKADARKLPNVHTKRQPNLTIWSLMIRSFSISCYKFSYPWF